jgi:hypothetical protein
MSDSTFYVGMLILISLIHGSVMVAVMVWVYNQVQDMHGQGTANQKSIMDTLDEFDSRLCALVAWAQLSRAASKDAEASVHKMEQTNQPARELIVAKLEQVPEVTAEKVAEKLTGDSGIARAVGTATPPTGVAALEIPELVPDSAVGTSQFTKEQLEAHRKPPSGPDRR